MQADESGDRAVSHFEPVEIFTANDNDEDHPGSCSLMKINIETGRTHQIRVHAQHCGHAIVGDSKYGNKITNKKFRNFGLKRLFLHAQHLYLPLSDPIDIEAELSDDLSLILNNLRQKQ